MSDGVKATIYFVLAVINFIMYFTWMLRPTLDYTESHRFCALVSFQIAAVNLIMGLFLAF